MKIITSKDTLRRVSGGTKGFQILSPGETNEFRDLLSNLLVGNLIIRFFVINTILETKFLKKENKVPRTKTTKQNMFNFREDNMNP